VTKAGKGKNKVKTKVNNKKAKTKAKAANGKQDSPLTQMVEGLVKKEGDFDSEKEKDEVHRSTPSIASSRPSTYFSCRIG
jgi:hypothetical protein